MRKYKIIIVENDEDEQIFIKEGFDATGLFEIVGQFKNGEELFEWLEKNSLSFPDIILSDLSMPGKNGYDILTEINDNPGYAHIPVIISSTSFIRSTVEKCLSLGAADYVVKPETFVEYAPFAKDLHRLIEKKGLVK